MNTKKTSNVSLTFRTQMYQKPDNSLLSKTAKQRLRWMEHFQKYRNARLTCRHFGISPDTFYLWKKRFDLKNLLTLEDDTKNRKPHTIRKPSYTSEQIEDVFMLKDVDSRLGRVLITKILKEKGHRISSSTVSRILKRDKK